MGATWDPGSLGTSTGGSDYVRTTYWTQENGAIQHCLPTVQNTTQLIPWTLPALGQGLLTNMR